MLMLFDAMCTCVNLFFSGEARKGGVQIRALDSLDSLDPWNCLFDASCFPSRTDCKADFVGTGLV